MRGHWVVVMVVALLLAGLSGRARGQDAETNLQVEEANGLVEQERYAEAGALFAELFGKTKDSQFLFKGGQAYARAGVRDKAMAMFQQYLAVDGGGVHAKAAYEQIARLSPDAGGRTGAPVVAPDREAERRQREAAAQQAREGRAARERAYLDAHPEVVASFHARQRSRRRLGLVIGAVGVASLGVGIAFALSASSISDEVSGATRWGDGWIDEAEAGERNQTLANVFIWGGVAVLTAGGIIYLTGRGGSAHAPREALSVSPALGPGSGGVRIAGSF